MLTKIEPTSSEYQVPYPEHSSEFEVQAMLFSALSRRGYVVRGEVVKRIPVVSGRKHVCRFDLVVYDARHKPLVVLEVKANSVHHKVPLQYTRQGRRYTRFGVPVWFVYGSNDVNTATAETMKCFPILETKGNTQ